MSGVAQQNSYNTFVADGVTTVFPYTFFAFTAATVKVYTIDGDNDPVDVSGSVTIAPNSSFIGGNVTFSPAPATGLKILIRREVAYTQEVEFANLTRYKESAIETALNVLALQIQQVKDIALRAIKFPETAAGTAPDFPAPLVADQYLRVNSTATALEYAALVSSGAIGIPVTIAQGGTNSTTAGGAFNNIVGPGGTITGPVTMSGAVIHSNTIGMSGAAINEAQGSNIASASTINLDTATGNLVDVTGTTGITAITLSQGRERTVRFTGVLTLTNGASLVLPGGTNITTAAGDFAVFRGYSGGVVRCVNYSKASGLAVVSPTLTTAYTNLFTSSEITVGAAGSNTLTAHGLGAVPTAVRVVLRCKTAELGYAVGDEVVLTADRGDNYGYQVYANATNVGIVIGVNGILIYNTSGSNTAITLGNWKFVIYAAK